MARCDFPTVYAIIKKYCIDCSATKQANLVPGMFYTYGDQHTSAFERTMINKMGKRKSSDNKRNCRIL